MFKAAAKLFTARDEEAPATARKRKSGEKESGARVHRRAIRLQTKVARGRYAGLRSIGRTTARLLRKFAMAADDAALPELSETPDTAAGNMFEWLNLWMQQDNAASGHGLDDHFDTQQNQNSPHL
jgi:hypothetical protein